MDGIGLLLVIGCAVWLLNRSIGASESRPRGGAKLTPRASPVANQQNEFQVVKNGFQPTDRCSCGGSWIKRANVETGGRFFSCSNYPRCTKSRVQVLKERLGSQYSLYYCSRGHEKAHFGVEYDQKSGRQVCKRCIAKGYVRDPRWS